MEFNREEYDKIIKECRDTSIIKNNDYGSESLTKFGNLGILIRISDKIDRLNNLIYNKKEQLVKDEKIEDTCQDMINYLIYMIMQERGKLLK